VRTTLTIDDDVMRLLEQEARQSGLPFKQVVNRRLRLGYTKRDAGPRRHFEVKARPMGLPAGAGYDNVGALIEALEGPEHK
jgi:hypothetical protein